MTPTDAFLFTVSALFVLIALLIVFLPGSPQTDAADPVQEEAAIPEMGEAGAERMAAAIREAGFWASKARWLDGDQTPPRLVWVVKTELSGGWDMIFSEEEWARHPDNPERSEPPNT